MSEKDLLNSEVNDDELENVSGGCGAPPDVHLCDGPAYNKNCAATVEEGSRCRSNDYCTFSDVSYARICTENAFPDYSGNGDTRDNIDGNLVDIRFINGEIDGSEE